MKTDLIAWPDSKSQSGRLFDQRIFKFQFRSFGFWKRCGRLRHCARIASFLCAESREALEKSDACSFGWLWKNGRKVENCTDIIPVPREWRKCLTQFLLAKSEFRCECKWSGGQQLRQDNSEKENFIQRTRDTSMKIDIQICEDVSGSMGKGLYRRSAEAWSANLGLWGRRSYDKNINLP